MSLTRVATESEFLKDVASHQMQVIRDNGVNRHIRFSRPSTSAMHFDLITWPGYLCYTGDMGTYVFKRLQDMFEFFRTAPPDNAGLYINLDYWSEKLEAVDRQSPAMEFSKGLFNEAVRSYLDNKDMTDEIRREIESQLLEPEMDEHDAYHAAYNFEEDGFRLEDFFEHNLKDYTFRFTWCCYALAWGIQQYDASKASGK